MENKNFSVKCFLPAFYVVALGPAVSFFRTIFKYSVCCFLSHIIFILVRFYFRDALDIVRESYTFLYRCSYVSSINLIKLKFLEFDE